MPLGRNIDGLTDHLFRIESGRMVAVLTRIFGISNSDIVEDIVQETFLTALRNWKIKGVPDNPSAWLMQVAKNKTINELKRRKKKVLATHDSHYFKDEHGKAIRIEHLFLDEEIKDSRLRLFFACCNPGLPKKSQVILSLRTLCGFSIQEIASALLMKREAVKKSLYRTRKELRENDVSLEVPFRVQAAERMPEVLKVIYLLFNEGYQRSVGSNLLSEDLCLEAARLAEEMVDEIPDFKGEVHALLSLFYFGMSRFDARETAQGEILDLENQDRGAWSRKLINLGFAQLRYSRSSKKISRYHLEAAISSLHATAKSYEETDWKRIVSYYNHLIQFDASPVIQISRAIAIGNAEGADKGLEALIVLEKSEQFVENHLFYAARGYLHFKSGDFESAKEYYNLAISLTDSAKERRYLDERLNIIKNELQRL